MNINFAILEELTENKELFRFQRPVDTTGIFLRNCYIEHLLAKIAYGYEPALIYHPLHCDIVHANPKDRNRISELPDRFSELLSTDMPTPIEGYGYDGNELAGILSSYFENSCFFDDVTYEIKKLCNNNAELCEEDAYPTAVANVKASYGYSEEEIKETLDDIDELYDQYLSHKSIQSILEDGLKTTDETLIGSFLESIPKQIQDLFREDASIFCSAYVTLVMYLLYASPASVCDGTLSISLWYDDSIGSLERLKKNGELGMIKRETREAYEKARELMLARKPTYCFGPDTMQHLQDALDNLNDLAPAGAFFLLSGRLDSYSMEEELYPDTGFQIGAVLSGLLAEEILSEIK